MRKSLGGWRLLAVAGAVATLLASAAAAAQAEIKFCSGNNTSQNCVITEQDYWSGGVQRSAMRGGFQGYLTGGLPTIRGWIEVRDVADNDGWRARAWVNIYLDCLCVNPGNRVRSWTFDAFTNSWTPHAWPEFKAERLGFTSITVQVIIGRYRGSTGQCDPSNCGAYANHEQRFYLSLG